jgi:hypothetical protein
MKINDITYLQAELDMATDGLIAYPSIGGTGVDLYSQEGFYVSTHDDCDEVRHEVLKG